MFLKCVLILSCWNCVLNDCALFVFIYIEIKNLAVDIASLYRWGSSLKVVVSVGKHNLDSIKNYSNIHVTLLLNLNKIFTTSVVVHCFIYFPIEKKYYWIYRKFFHWDYLDKWSYGNKKFIMIYFSFLHKPFLEDTLHRITVSKSLLIYGQSDSRNKLFHVKFHRDHAQVKRFTVSKTHVRFRDSHLLLALSFQWHLHHC